MPTYEKSEEWLHQSSLLIEARPSTTRVTTRYSISPARRRRAATDSKDGGDGSDTAMTDAKPPRGQLVLKTYDPVSGAALKYRTSKAAEVTRLVQMLSSLGRRMAALPTTPATAASADAAMLDVPAAEGGSGAQTPVAGGAGGSGSGQGGQPQQQGGGKGKKKRGKR